MMTNPLQATFVTDVPFWNAATGAQLRILQLIQQLDSPEMNCNALITQWNASIGSEQIQSQTDIPLQFIDASQPPQTGIKSKANWYAAAVANRFGFSRNESFTPTLNEYYPRAIVNRFVEQVEASRPDILIFEYVNQVQLMRALPIGTRQSIVCAVDTHDILWQRNDQFRAQGQAHWLDATQQDEETALAEYDLIIAIQAKEADYFATIASPEKVSTTAMEFRATSTTNSAAESPRIGLLSSNNWANVDTVTEVLRVWPQILAERQDLKFVLAGSICESEEIRKLTATTTNIQIMGKVESPEDFYEQVDIVWNPVRYGTGLKIKNLEALAHAKCLVTSPHGATGLDATESKTLADRQKPFVVLDSPDAASAFFKGLDSDLIQALSQNGVNHLESHFGAGTQYPPLRQKLATLCSLKSV